MADKELSDFRRKNKIIEELEKENTVLTARIQEMEKIRQQLEQSNEIVRDKLAKKNVTDDQLEKAAEELISAKLEIERLNSLFASQEQKIKDAAAKEISLNSNLEKFRKIESEKNSILEDLEKLNLAKLGVESDLEKLRNENEGLKKRIGVKNSKMNTFKTVVIFLAVLANFLLLGKKFMGLANEKDWQTYVISYGSVLIFDLTVIFLTMVNRSKEALYFSIGVFVLTFFQIGKPFLGLGLDVAFYGFDLLYFERIISGCIYSFFFASLSYFLSKIKVES